MRSSRSGGSERGVKIAERYGTPPVGEHEQCVVAADVQKEAWHSGGGTYAFQPILIPSTTISMRSYRRSEAVILLSARSNLPLQLVRPDSP